MTYTYSIMANITTTLKTPAELRYMTAYERAVYEQSISVTEPELDYTNYEEMEEGYVGDDAYYSHDFGLHIDMPHHENL